MTKRRKWHIVVLVVLLTAFLVGFGTAPKQVQALSFGGALKGALKIFGIAYVVKRFGGQINSFINGVLGEHAAQIQGQTKVVPILAIGSDAAIGAAQVMGPAEQVNKVNGVAEVDWRPGGVFRARGLIPVATTKLTSVKGVGGVGVSANIKFPL